MQSLKDKIVFITGASSGMGKACALQFAALGARVILTARRLDKITELANEIKQQFRIEALPIQLDIQDKNRVKTVVEQLPNDWKNIDILVNNAGCALATDTIQEGNTDNWDIMINTNFKGLLYVTREILPGMIARNKGHIINIGSSAGHEHYPRGNVYSATKHAVNAISHSLRLDLLGTGIRVSEVDPGAVETEFSIVRWQDEKRAKEFYADFTPLTPDDIAESVIFCATRKPYVNIAQMIVYPIDQASVNHLYRPGKPAENVFEK